MVQLASKRAFPCPVCNKPLDVRASKKRRPYVVCDYCGVQMFVRYPVGIRAFNRQVESADREGTWKAIAKMESRYFKQCPECGCRFWIKASHIETSWLTGEFLGYRCPGEDCHGVVKEEQEE